MTAHARSFFYHFNKPASRAAGRPQISVHWRGACHIVDNIQCDVPTWGRLNKRQPMFTITGKGVLHVIELNGARIAIINNNPRMLASVIKATV